jgi:hypothetical protein
MTKKEAKGLLQLQFFLIFVGALGLCLLTDGRYWGLILTIPVVLVGFASTLSSKDRKTSMTVTASPNPNPESYRTLTKPDERQAFDGLLALAERIDKTLPALAGLVDSKDAASLVAQSLWEGAGLLARRQEIRGVRDELQTFAHPGSPKTNRARQDLEGQQRRADALWNEVNKDLEGLVSHLTATAEAGEAFIRDRELDETLQRTEEALTKLSLDGSHAGAYAGEQLAEETTAVLTAYRDLNDLYGGKS